MVSDRLGSLGGPARYYPYGQERQATPEGTEKFATYYRDATGLDYAWNRYYTAAWGRFLREGQCASGCTGRGGGAVGD